MPGLYRPGDFDLVGFIVGVVIDITERKQAEELRVHSVRLEAQNRQIQEANRLKGEFLANMSHELRTPLNAVIGFAEILRVGEVRLPETKRAEYLGHIAASGRHLLRLINDVLDLSKVESGKFDLVPEPLQLAQLVREVTAVLQPEAARKAVQVSVQVDPTLTDLVLDPARLKQMLYNLLSNAIKFSDKRKGRIKIGWSTRDDECIFSIADNGSGIPAEELARVFVPFRRLPSHRDIPGSGLGLYFAKTMIEQQDGRLWVESELGSGSCFYVLLKLAPARN